MSNTLYVLIEQRNLPTRSEWQASINACGFDLVLDDDFDPRTHSGALPCRLFGEEAFLEFYLTESLEDLDDLAELAPDADACVALQWDGSESDMAAAAIACFALERDFSATASYEGEPPMADIDARRREVEALVEPVRPGNPTAIAKKAERTEAFLAFNALVAELGLSQTVAGVWCRRRTGVVEVASLRVKTIDTRSSFGVDLQIRSRLHLFYEDSLGLESGRHRPCVGPGSDDHRWREDRSVPRLHLSYNASRSSEKTRCLDNVGKFVSLRLAPWLERMQSPKAVVAAISPDLSWTLRRKARRALSKPPTEAELARACEELGAGLAKLPVAGS